LEVDGERPQHPVLLFHGNPDSAGSWTPFLERLAGRRRVLAPDLLGWGESERPADFRFTMDALAGWTCDLIDALEIERFDIAVHDWGAIALAAAVRRPAAVDRVVVMNAVPFTAAYRWHWIARLWRRRGVGELLNATMTELGTRQLLRQATPRRATIPELAARIHRHLDAGTKRAILELYRDADPERLEAVGRRLHTLRGPALVVWGDADPYIGMRFADGYAAALGGEARVVHLPDAGHWPWLDRPDVVDTVCELFASQHC